MHLWKLWDEVAIEEASMYGWWNKSNPVKVFDVHGDQLSEKILATAYVRPGNVTLVAIASWDASNTTVSLVFDWKIIGLAPERASVTAPYIPSFNGHNRPLVFGADDDHDDRRISLIVPAYKGWLLVVK